MSEPGLSVEEELFLSDIFDEVNNVTSNHDVSNNSSSMSIDDDEPESSDDRPDWKGVSMDEIYRGLGVYGCKELPSISLSSSHTVLISLPLSAHGAPKPYPSHQVDKWCQDFVRMPHSKYNLYPVEQDGTRRCRNRWELIQESLLQSFVSSQQLETAILSYNHTYAERWNFAALHHFFSETVDEDEMNIFFDVLMPKMVQLALHLPVLVTGAVPLLKRHTNATITLSQLQIACLLANAFFCTFPRRNSTSPQSEYGTYPYINFNRLFSACRRDKWNRCASVMEKLKCIFHYFRRVTAKAPEGVVTIQRRYIPKSDCPKWDEQVQKLPPLHVTSKGTIEMEGAGLLQVDFANKYVGGGVLGFGCVQEEIRFVICPELLITMLVTEELDDTEALVVCGIERYSKYDGYSNTFKWTGDFVDETPVDSCKRRLTSVVAIDALHFKQASSQFSIGNIRRELNKAYAGFVGCESKRTNLPAIATGNWGCGAYRGNPKLKVLLQLIAAAVAGRSVVYFTFGDTSLRDDIAEMYSHLTKQEANIAHIFSLLLQYQEFATVRRMDFYKFLYSGGKTRPLTHYLNKSLQANKNSTVKELIFKRSKSVSIDDRKCFRSDFKGPETEEERIQRWLTDCEEGTSKRKTNTIIEENAQGTDGAEEELSQDSDSIGKKEEHIQDKTSTEKKRKPSLLKMLEDTVHSRTIPVQKRMSALEFFDSQEFISHQTSDDCGPLTKVDSKPMVKSSRTHSTSESAHPSTETCTAIPNKRDSLCKKSGQRKISDFFQRTS
nr:poly(ADP-ribose) glycohydrolase isoform X1 [Megalopta genalis]XP_033338422.1 poly(ADP-ribose) glycohydrolase isoform X1 [Megalopta genalis]XP_033338424.1 poly(ADP-ribose) glycohydrolase isoform X1 [Megalopta genalis]XP_033338425.1 poly(ADP-ribose) glycohydrolase isoform X1 [Megalopta genalis]XP_033338426.1 poly(ADP-ribose) glycohydrolase isoform X1 [Megalopta genalis]XP_033338427.1 poly(ADP-ribose) glycohydrolase isoform X1 [Megalopta genalis]